MNKLHTQIFCGHPSIRAISTTRRSTCVAIYNSTFINCSRIHSKSNWMGNRICTSSRHFSSCIRHSIKWSSLYTCSHVQNSTLNRETKQCTINIHRLVYVERMHLCVKWQTWVRSRDNLKLCFPLYRFVWPISDPSNTPYFVTTIGYLVCVSWLRRESFCQISHDV